MISLLITRAGPLATIQDAGRFGMLRHGISASGPMDRGGFRCASAILGNAGTSAIEFTRAGLAFTIEGGTVRLAGAGGDFRLHRNGEARPWPADLQLNPGDRVDITPGEAGNYGYLRFAAEIDVPEILGSRATNSIAGLGGLAGRPLVAGDRLVLSPLPKSEVSRRTAPVASAGGDAALRFVWGLHADLFSAATRQAFTAAEFVVSSHMDRMGVRLEDKAAVFARTRILSLVSDPIVSGDIQILGNGTPIVLMRDYQPTGGYPRIASIIAADLDRFAQLRPGAPVAFAPISPERAHALAQSPTGAA